MPTAIDPEEIERLSGALKERILAKDAASRRGAMTPRSPIALLGFAACAIAAVAGIGALLLHPAAQKVAPVAASDAATGRVSTAEPGSAPATSADAPPPPAEPAPSVQPVHEATQPEVATTATVPPTVAAPAEPVPAVRPAPRAPAPEAPSSAAAPAPKPPPDRLHLAAADIAALLARGDSLLGVGDIASARLFYERASDAGDGRAALRLGATYDPGFLDQVHLPHLNGDVVQALSWYRRARELGETEAERWIQGLETKSGR
jgi:TPR repeat protein